MLNTQKYRIMRYVDKNRINIETDNDIVGNCRFSVASEKFDNEVLIDFRRKSCEKSCMENSI